MQSGMLGRSSATAKRLGVASVYLACSEPCLADRKRCGDRGQGLRVVPVMPDDLFDRPIRSLSALAAAEAECTRCPLYKSATQVVPGEGRRNSGLMLVGEQPGDKEDIAGKPFVGPAGRILDQALADAGIPRNDVFVTNAVKHFKFEQRGKRRLHKRPNAYELQRCKWWLEHERAIIRPAAIVEHAGRNHR